MAGSSLMILAQKEAKASAIFARGDRSLAPGIRTHALRANITKVQSSTNWYAMKPFGCSPGPCSGLPRGLEVALSVEGGCLSEDELEAETDVCLEGSTDSWICANTASLAANLRSARC